MASKDKADHLFKIISLDNERARLREIDTITGQFSDKKFVTVEYGPNARGYNEILDVAPMGQANAVKPASEGNGKSDDIPF